MFASKVLSRSATEVELSAADTRASGISERAGAIVLQLREAVDEVAQISGASGDLAELSHQLKDSLSRFKVR